MDDLEKLMFEKQHIYEALTRLFDIAQRDTGQAGRVANFLLAWYNAAENGGWDPTDFWNVDSAIAADMLTVLGFIRGCHLYPDAMGFEKEIQSVWRLWRRTIQKTDE